MKRLNYKNELQIIHDLHSNIISYIWEQPFSLLFLVIYSIWFMGWPQNKYHNGGPIISYIIYLFVFMGDYLSWVFLIIIANKKYI